MTATEQQPLDGFVIEPSRPEIGRAADIICGHDLIQGLDQETAGNFHMFVYEVLDTTVGAEIRRLERAIEILQADAAPLEASFNNAADLLEWLDAPSPSHPER
jgi:hypothetical protein